MDIVTDGDIATGFKLAMRRMTSTISLITTQHDGRPYGMAATAVQSVCADPPTILICVNRSASISQPLTERGRFAVNLLSTTHKDLVSVFSGKVKSEERFIYGTWDMLEGMPVLADAQAVMVCDQVASLTVGSHEILVGEVRAVQVDSSITPLLYQDGKLAQSLLLD